MTDKPKRTGPIIARVEPKEPELSERTKRRKRIMAEEGLTRKEFAQKYGSK